jgi:hypothetical protein
MGLATTVSIVVVLVLVVVLAIGFAIDKYAEGTETNHS